MMGPMLKGIVWTQVLAAVSGLAYFIVLTYRRHPDAAGVGLRIWGYFAAIFILLHAFLALKLWWERWRSRR